MKELEITHGLDGNEDKLIILPQGLYNEKLFLRLNDGKKENSIVLKKYQVKEIFFYLQNYLNL